MKNVLFAVALAGLTGCTTLSYQEPAEGQRARVRFVTTTGSIAILRTYDDANCTVNEKEWMRLRAGPLLFGGTKKLDLPLWKYQENAAKEVYVSASKPIHGVFSATASTNYHTYPCGVPFTYSFSENVDYEVKFRGGAAQCEVVISQFVLGEKGWSLREVQKFSNDLNEANKGCVDQINKTRLY